MKTSKIAIALLTSAVALASLTQVASASLPRREQRNAYYHESPWQADMQTLQGRRTPFWDLDHFPGNGNG